jgi:hypothetical protein
MKNIKTVGAVLGMFALGLYMSATASLAAADTMVTGAIASSSSWFTDNLTVLLNFVLDILFKFGAYALAIGAVSFIIYFLIRIFKRKH